MVQTYTLNSRHFAAQEKKNFQARHNGLLSVIPGVLEAEIRTAV
jgi:hypothetical protein